MSLGMGWRAEQCREGDAQEADRRSAQPQPSLLIRLPPLFKKLAASSSSALCVTLAFSKSLKLLPMLGVPSLPDLLLWGGDFALIRPASSAWRRGERMAFAGVGWDASAGEAISEVEDASDWDSMRCAWGGLEGPASGCRSLPLWL